MSANANTNNASDSALNSSRSSTSNPIRASNSRSIRYRYLRKKNRDPLSKAQINLLHKRFEFEWLIYHIDVSPANIKTFETAKSLIQYNLARASSMRSLLLPMIEKKLEDCEINKILQSIRAHRPIEANQIRGYFDGAFKDDPNAKDNVNRILETLQDEQANLYWAIDEMKKFVNPLTGESERAERKSPDMSIIDILFA